MAGVKGRSGGRRAGSGPKRKPVEPLTAQGPEPLSFLLAVQNDPAANPALRVRAAIAAAQYMHPKMGDGGKKHRQKADAERAMAGKFAPAAAPKLVVNNKR